MIWVVLMLTLVLSMVFFALIFALIGLAAAKRREKTAVFDSSTSQRNASKKFISEKKSKLSDILFRRNDSRNSYILRK